MKNIMLKAILLIIFMTTYLQAFNQGNLGLNKSLTDFSELIRKDAFGKVVLTEDDIEGSAYLTDDFVLGTITTKEDILYT